MTGLLHLGISADAEDVYRCLLRNPAMRAEDLVAATGLDRDAMERALEQLELCGMIRSSGRHLQVVDPAFAVERLIEERHEAASAELQRLSAARSVIASLVRERESERDLSALVDLEHIEGLDQVRGSLEDLAFFARQEVLALHSDGPLHPAAIEAARPLDLRCLRRGVTLRTLLHQDALADPETVAYVA
ncbi:helix-turn-helix transcriptional regulator, partial [Streptomyces sp. SID5770]|nr:helix-turn-helix transcriptional regulator [Streptomyces sp. SID5770]